MSLAPNSAFEQSRRPKNIGLVIDAHIPMIGEGQNAGRLPPLKSPRGHLLDRIRSTPRTSKFIPQTISTLDGNTLTDAYESQQPHSTPPAKANVLLAPEHDRSQSLPPWESGVRASSQRQDPASADQLAILTQKLRQQKDLLAQQQYLLRQLHLQQAAGCPATPPFTPTSGGQRQYHSFTHSSYGANAANAVMYNQVTGQFMTYQPNMVDAQISTPLQKHRQAYSTPTSIPRPQHVQNILSLQKDSLQRQPRGPPSMDILSKDTANNLNFGSRTRQRATQILEAGLLRRRNSPGPHLSRPSSRTSSKSGGILGSIDEAFPVMTLE